MLVMISFIPHWRELMLVSVVVLFGMASFERISVCDVKNREFTAVSFYVSVGGSFCLIGKLGNILSLPR